MVNEVVYSGGSGKVLNCFVRKYTNQRSTAASTSDIRTSTPSESDDSNSPNSDSIKPYSSTVSVEIRMDKPMWGSIPDHLDIECVFKTRLPLVHYYTNRELNQFGYSSLESPLVKSALPQELRHMIWHQALWSRTDGYTDDFEGSVGLFRLRQTAAAARKRISTPWDQKYDELNIGDMWRGSEGKYSIYEGFSENDYFPLMAFAENLSEEDFQEFGKFFWKNTVLWLFDVVERPLLEDSDELASYWMLGGVEWLNRSPEYHDNIENISCAFVSPWKWGENFEDMKYEFMKLCAQLSKLTNLQTVTFHLEFDQFDHRRTEDQGMEESPMEAVLERIASGELVDWVTACRELPVQKSFEIWVSALDRGEYPEPGPDGPTRQWYEAFNEARPDYDQLYQKYHGSLMELLTPNSVRKLAEPPAPISDMEKYLASRSELYHSRRNR